MGRRWAGHLPRNHGDGKNAAITANIPGRRPSDSGPSGEGKEGDAKPPPRGFRHVPGAAHPRPRYPPPSPDPLTAEPPTPPHLFVYCQVYVGADPPDFKGLFEGSDVVEAGLFGWLG